MPQHYSDQVIGIGVRVRDSHDPEQTLSDYRQYLVPEFKREFTEFQSEVDAGLAESFADYHVGQLRSFVERERDKAKVKASGWDKTKGEAADARAQERADTLLKDYENIMAGRYPEFCEHWRTTEEDLPRLATVVGLAYRKMVDELPDDYRLPASKPASASRQRA